jgi:hypothetical protein
MLLTLPVAVVEFSGVRGIDAQNEDCLDSIEAINMLRDMGFAVVGQCF